MKRDCKMYNFIRKSLKYYKYKKNKYNKFILYGFKYIHYFILATVFQILGVYIEIKISAIIGNILNN